VADEQPDPKRLKLRQPRLGIVYDITRHGTTVIRASARLFDVRTTRSRGLSVPDQIRRDTIDCDVTERSAACGSDQTDSGPPHRFRTGGRIGTWWPQMANEPRKNATDDFHGGYRAGEIGTYVGTCRWAPKQTRPG
jgi:hypothetical protein